MRHLTIVGLAALITTGCQDPTAPRDSAGPTPALVASAGRGFTVKSTADAVDVNPGDGRCATAEGVCTLRAAIMETNALPGDKSISLPAGHYRLRIPGAYEDGGATGDLDISSNLTIRGAGAEHSIIDGNGSGLNDRVLHITGAFTVNLLGVAITGGSSDEGGGIFAAAGAALSLAHSTVRGNVAAFNGGGIRTDGGALALFKSTVAGNSAPGGSGGGIFSAGALTLTNSGVSGNTALGGGGIFMFPFTTATVVGSTVRDNTAEGFGGGISSLGTLTLTNSTVSGNRANFNGGGISHELGSLLVTHSSIVGNSAANAGGGIFTASAATLQNSLVAGNLSGGNCAGGPVDGGGNLSWPDVTCPGLNADPLLGPLANNGGPTMTHALPPGSPAVDAAVSANCPATDQRGVSRPQGPRCDIGAFELRFR